MTSGDTAPDVVIVTTGGTIALLGRDRLDLAWYGEELRFREAGALVASVPELARFANVRERPFRTLPSHDVTSGDWLDLLRLLHDELTTDATGAVVTHGTNTIEETAFFLHLALKSAKPVVLVGAMRPPSALGTDAELNLVSAVRVAASPEAGGKGVMVVLNDRIISARDVSKSDVYRLDAFSSRDLGPLGFADPDGTVVFYHVPFRPHTTATPFEVSELSELPRVDVVISHVDATGDGIDAAVTAGARGLVIAGAGAGFATPSQDTAAARAVDAGVVVCRTSRAGAGRLARSPTFRARGEVAGDNLPAWKARVLLSLALTATIDPEAIQPMFDRF